LPWVRLLYIYPTVLTLRMVDVIAEHDALLPYLDMPLQHADRDVLRSMNRPSDPDMTRRLIDHARTRLPNLTMRTTFIVGYPGETEEQFERLLAFVEAEEFDHVGVFTYSHEEGTSAHELADDVPAALKKKRRDRLMRAQKRFVATRHRGRVGEKVRLLVDGPASEHELVLKGRLATQAPDIDAAVYLTECDPSQFRAGEFTDVEIVGARDYDLIARPVL
jgi:ribosomal protein S12 methylthiotransferase